ncbi:hypothetical protein [Sphingomonas rubra]|uniref:Uncharacterized protein n=1 Tax=Sphingomonas rubra TaxID=634430 RepID=A0A1I5SPD5_9SPHN|nr:hypothetical protein [Sphingomonas rubra]SFP72585.1 hypothetical protein SAMN04488241_10636 [Sphingomonas rubra]
MKTIAMIAVLMTSGALHAQDAHPRDTDKVRIQNQESRQYRGEPKANATKRNTRCRIVRQRGQDKRVCGQPVKSGR